MKKFKIYTIGFTKKSASEFFELLELNKVKLVLDVRLNNVSQLAGFSKGRDLKYFLKKINNIDYIHDIRFSPTKDILDNYKKNNITWHDYEVGFLELLQNRDIKNVIKNEYLDCLDSICLLCSESEYEFCHRNLVATFMKDNIKTHDIEIIHI